MADARLSQHIEKGNEDGLFISSVASSQNLWAIIMDAGTNFSAQVYEVSPQFLRKVYIIVSLIYLKQLPATFMLSLLFLFQQFICCFAQLLILNLCGNNVNCLVWLW